MYIKHRTMTDPTATIPERDIPTPPAVHIPNTHKNIHTNTTKYHESTDEIPTPNRHDRQTKSLVKPLIRITISITPKLSIIHIILKTRDNVFSTMQSTSSLNVIGIQHLLRLNFVDKRIKVPPIQRNCTTIYSPKFC